jgi:hypothetical protein
MKTKLVFNHETENFNEGIGISDEISLKAREKIIFNCINNCIQRDLLYGEDTDDEAPREMKTITGDLERLIEMLDDELELYAVLFNFKSLEAVCIQTYGKYKFIKNADSREDSLKVKLISLLQELQNASSDSDDKLSIDNINEKTMFKRIEFIKRSHCNFNTYMKMLKRWVNGENMDIDDKDITNLINQILNKSDENAD